MCGFKNTSLQKIVLRVCFQAKQVDTSGAEVSSFILGTNYGYSGEKV